MVARKDLDVVTSLLQRDSRIHDESFCSTCGRRERVSSGLFARQEGLDKAVWGMWVRSGAQASDSDSFSAVGLAARISNSCDEGWRLTQAKVGVDEGDSKMRREMDVGVLVRVHGRRLLGLHRAGNPVLALYSSSKRRSKRVGERSEGDHRLETEIGLEVHARARETNCRPA